MSWPYDTPAPGRFSLSRVMAAREAHARRRAAPPAGPMVQMQGRDAWPARANSPEMAVYDPSEDDDRREAMSPGEAWLLMVICVLSACFVAWLLAVLSAYFGALPR